MRDYALDGRLASVRKFVRQGAQFADIGTDHAYLPLFLLAEGRIERAVCSDINEGPLNSARVNARDAGLADRVKFVLTDGAAALADEGLTDVAIAGMGGELIADIIERAPFLRDGSIRLILQPMSKQGHLRRYLAEAGFEIFQEDYSYSAGKYYVTLAAHYTGMRRSITNVVAELGEARFLEEPSAEARGYLTVKREMLKKIADGKTKGGEDAALEIELYNYIKELL